MTKILFLDVDGVLNHRAVFLPSRKGSPLCPDALWRLNQVVGATGCHVVLSSTWRMLSAHVAELSRAGGFPNPHADWRTIDGAGPKINGIIHPSHRGQEIAEWLGRHPEVERYAIVDDDDDMLPEQAACFVRTSFETGLLDEHVARLVAILSSGAPA